MSLTKELRVGRGSSWPIATAVLLLALAVVWPSDGITIGDETIYLGHARSIASGHFSPIPGAPLFSQTLTEAGAPSPKYPVGVPLLLGGLWAIGGAKALPLYGVCCLLALLALLVTDARRAGLPLILPAALVLHPTVILLGRTMMSDVLASVVLLAVVVALERRQLTLAGVAIGALLAIRLPAAAAALTGASVFLLIELRVSGPRAAAVAAARGALPVGVFAIAVLLVNRSIWGAWSFATHVSSGAHAGKQMFSIDYLLTSGPPLLLGLTLMPPGLLILGAWSAWRTGKVPRLAAALALVALQSVYFFVDSGRTWPETLVISQRLVLPAVVVLLVPYAGELWRLLDRLPRLRAAGAVAGVVAMSISAVSIAYQQDKILAPQRAARDAVEKHVDDAELNVAWSAARVAALVQGPRSFRPSNDTESASGLLIYSESDPSYRRNRAAHIRVPNHCTPVATSGTYRLVRCGSRP